MKKNGLFYSIVFLIPCFTHTQPNFELWNKHTNPVYYSISNSIQEASVKPLELLQPGKWTPAITVDINKPTVIAIVPDKLPDPGQRIDAYSIRPGKTIFVRYGLPPEKEKVKEIIKYLLRRTSIEANGYLFGPQTGPLLGFRGITEKGHSLKNNLSKKDITKDSIVYLPKNK